VPDTSPRPTGALPFETASWGRRILAFVLDGAISAVAVIAVMGIDDYLDDPSARWWVLTVWLMETTAMTWLGGGSLGKLFTGLCVVPASGPLRRVNPARILGRQVLVALVIPPLVFKPDGRGLHDLFAGTATVTFATLQELRAA
jgi:uncharacterized RDD family membrane protein YckC